MGRIYQRVKGGTWYGYWTDLRGRHHRQSLGTRDAPVARARLRQLELVSTDPAAHSRHTLSAAIADMLAVVATENASATHGAYQQKGRHLVRVIGDLELGEVTRDRVLLYIRTRQHETASNGTIHKELVVLRRALSEAIERKKWAGTVSAIVPKIKVNYQPRETWLTEHQAEQFIARLPARRRLWAMLAAWGGLCLGEIERLRWEHIDIVRGKMRVPGTKRASRYRNIPITERLLGALRSARPAKGVGPVVDRWRNVRRDMALACELAKVPKVTPNDLRRTFASWLKNRGTDSSMVAQLLGHSSTKMVDLVYGKLSERSLADAVRRLPGGVACATGEQDAVASARTNETGANVIQLRKAANR